MQKIVKWCRSFLMASADVSLNSLFCLTVQNPKIIQFVVREKQQMIKVKKLEQENIWYCGLINDKRLSIHASPHSISALIQCFNSIKSTHHFTSCCSLKVLTSNFSGMFSALNQSNQVRDQIKVCSMTRATDFNMNSQKMNPSRPIEAKRLECCRDRRSYHVTFGGGQPWTVQESLTVMPSQTVWALRGIGKSGVFWLRSSRYFLCINAFFSAWSILQYK